MKCEHPGCLREATQRHEIEVDNGCGTIEVCDDPICLEHYLQIVRSALSAAMLLEVRGLDEDEVCRVITAKIDNGDYDCPCTRVHFKISEPTLKNQSLN